MDLALDAVLRAEDGGLWRVEKMPVLVPATGRNKEKDRVQGFGGRGREAKGGRSRRGRAYGLIEGL